ncbi:hypothetical protein ES703_76937 [subsurface metagenome]
MHSKKYSPVSQKHISIVHHHWVFHASLTIEDRNAGKREGYAIAVKAKMLYDLPTNRSNIFKICGSGIIDRRNPDSSLRR